MGRRECATKPNVETSEELNLLEREKAMKFRAWYIILIFVAFSSVISGCSQNESKSMNITSSPDLYLKTKSKTKEVKREKEGRKYRTQKSMKKY